MKRTVVLVLLLALAGSAIAQIRFPQRAAGEVVVDEARILYAADEQRIEALSREAEGQGAPIVVCTIPSLQTMGAGNMSIEAYATRLFNHWKLGDAKVNRGMLLLVSVRDRKARIELGKGWGRSHDKQAASVMQTYVIPQFKTGRYSSGIVDGVQGLRNLAMGVPIPVVSTPRTASETSAIVFVISFIAGLIILITLSVRFGWLQGDHSGYYAGSHWHSTDSTWSSSDGGWGGGGGGFSGGGGGSSGGGGSTGGW